MREEIKRGDIKDSYFLTDENDFIKEEIIRLLETILIKEKTGVFDKTKFYGDELPDDVYRQMCSPPIASKRHLSVIFNIDRIRKGKEQIKKAIESSSPLLCIVLTAGKTNNRKTIKSIEWFLNNVYTLRCGRFSRKEIERWILETVENSGSGISRDAIDLLWEFTGDNMFSLHSEIEKLLAFKPDEKIGVEEVKAIVGEERMLSISTLERAICDGDIAGGIKALENLFMWGDDPTAILYRLKVWLSASLSGKGWKGSLGFDDAAAAISMLMETELAIKLGKTDGKFALEDLVYKLTNRK